jgi:carboxymethylenebutenolidase
MCHDTNSRPPGVSDPGAIAEERAVELSSADGSSFPAYYALPAEPHANGRGVVILPDVRGAHPFYRALAGRFAEAGYSAVVMDYYGRIAGTTDRGEGFDWQPLVRQVRPEQVAEDAAAAVAFLRERTADALTLFSVGFCMGGGQSWRLAAEAERLGLAGAIGFYGIPRVAEDRIGDFSVPLLMLLAGDDAATPPESFEEFTNRLTAAGKSFERHTYEGAPHSFFDREAAEWRSACEDAWQRIEDFTARLAA